jgi:hypothetical protein
MKIAGLDKLTKQLDDAQRALKELDGELGVVNFDPNDPESINLAIKSMESTIDERVGRYSNNPIIAPLIAGMRKSYRSAILEKAAAARIESES